MSRESESVKRLVLELLGIIAVLRDGNDRQRRESGAYAVDLQRQIDAALREWDRQRDHDQQVVSQLKRLLSDARWRAERAEARLHEAKIDEGTWRERYEIAEAERAGWQLLAIHLEEQVQESRSVLGLAE